MDTAGGGSALALIGVAGTAWITNKVNKRTVQEARRDKATAERQANHAVLETISIKAHEIARAVGDHNLDDVMWNGHLDSIQYPSKEDKKQVEMFLRESYAKCSIVIEEGKDFIREKEVVLRGRDDNAADLVKGLLETIETDLETFNTYDDVGRQEQTLSQSIENYANDIRDYRTATKKKRRLIPRRPSRG